MAQMMEQVHENTESQDFQSEKNKCEENKN